MKRTAPILLLVVAALAAAPAHALDYHLRLYGAASYVAPVSDSSINGVKTDAASALGYELGLEWKFAKLVGIEAAYTDTKHDVEVNGVTAGKIDFAPIHASLNFHIIRTKMLTWWVGATASYANWGDLKFNDGTSAPVDKKWGYGASTGVMVSIIKTLAFQAGVRWIKLDLVESSTGQKLNVDPLFAHAGLALRF